jgi:hypothetical protein
MVLMASVLQRLTTCALRNTQPVFLLSTDAEIQRPLSFSNAFNGGRGGGVRSPLGNILRAYGALVKWANHVDTITA